jgi:LysM repeat protein
MLQLAVITRFLRRMAPGSAALMFSVTACKGPDNSPRVVPLNITDQAQLAPQMVDGPRRDNAERELEKQASRIAQQLFRAEPMAKDIPPEEARVHAEPAEEPLPVRPAWADGVEQPSDAGENDLPQGWPVEVRRGETPALLAQWSGQDAKEILFVNTEALGNRKWLKVGDRITVHMSANRKVAFDRLRDAFQRERVESYFSNRYFKDVVVYRVKKGEFVATAAKRYGDVPLWLIEEFNQIDFRSLQPGDEILIPVVAEMPAGMRQPPPLRVVDEAGHPLAAAHVDALAPKIRSDFMAKARMAIDDSNVFMRAGPMPQQGGHPVAGQQPQGHAPAQPAPGQYQLPAARIGQLPDARPTEPHPLLPDYRGYGQAQQPARVPEVPQAPQHPPSFPAAHQQVGAPSVSPYSAAHRPAEPAPMAPAPGGMPRDVVVKRGESLMHYVRWSRVPLDAIKTTNPHLDPDRIFVGARIAIPMGDDQYVEFVKARALWEKERAEEAANPAGKPDKNAKAANAPKAPKVPTKTHTVKSGETATSIARAHRVEVKDLRSANPGVDLKRLKVGAKLTVPPKGR